MQNSFAHFAYIIYVPKAKNVGLLHYLKVKSLRFITYDFAELTT